MIEGINDLSTLKPELASAWSEKNEIKPTEVSIGSHKKVKWKCKLEHEWIATVKSRTINKTGCPYCSHNKVIAGFNDLATLFPEVADERSDKNEKSLPKLWRLQTARLGGSAEPAVMNGIRLSLHAQAAVNVLVAVDIYL